MALPLVRFNGLKRPSYLERAVRRKYNAGFIGAKEEDIEHFWERVRYRSLDTADFQRPTEKLRTIVDISAKEHVNFGDRPDFVQIKGSKAKGKEKSKTFQLTFGENWKYTFGGGVNMGITFFNPTFASPSIGAGLNGQVKRGKSRQYHEGVKTTESLLHTYRVVSKVKVSPRSKMTARITTYAVTWELPVKTEVSCRASLSIPVKTTSTGCCEGVFTSRPQRKVTAQDLFREEPDYRVEGDTVYFTRDSALSYVGETIEVTKTEKRLND